MRIRIHTQSRPPVAKPFRRPMNLALGATPANKEEVIKEERYYR
jgi:hypothetical protein